MYDIDSFSREVLHTHWFFTIDGVNILQSDLYAYCTDVKENSYHDRQCFVDIPKPIDAWLMRYNIITPCYSGHERSASQGMQAFINWMEKL